MIFYKIIKKKFHEKHSILFVVIGAVVVWIGVHLPGIFYGTEDTPLHVSYLSADEQSPVNGALHVLKEKSIFGLRNQNTLYYGPIFALIAVPGVVIDYSTKFLSGKVNGAESYKNYIIWDWGGILRLVRLTAVLFGFSSLLAVYFIFQTNTVNPSGNKLIPFVAVGVLGTNFLFFEYSNFFRHWVFVITFLLWQLYLAILLLEKREKRVLLWSAQSVLTIASFGISYLSVIYQIFWLPLFIKWAREKEWELLKEFAVYIFSLIIGLGLIFWWHPYGFIRLLGLVGILKPISIGPVLDLGTQGPEGHSFLFYGLVFFVNSLPLVISFLFLAVSWIREKTYIFDWVVLMIFLAPTITNYVVFSIPAHHESRYILPTVVLFVLFVLYIFSKSFFLNKEKMLFRLASFFLALSVLFGIFQIVLWQKMMISGPVERQDIISQIHQWQKTAPETKTLVLKDWPLGYIHTHEAYVDYVNRFEKSKYDLWQSIIKIDPPQDIVPINVYYSHDKNLADEEYARYEHIIKYVRPRVGGDIAYESSLDEFDIRPWHLWDYAKYREVFEIIK